MIIIIIIIVFFSLRRTRKLMHYSNTCTEAPLHAHCEDIIAPGTLGHIAQKTLHLAATNSTTGQHHNTNSFHTQTFRSRIPTKNMPKNPGRVILASRRPSRQPPKRAQRLPIPICQIRKSKKSGSAFGRNLADLEKFSRWAG